MDDLNKRMGNGLKEDGEDFIGNVWLHIVFAFILNAQTGLLPDFENGQFDLDADCVIGANTA